MSGFITNGELRIEAERLCDENERLHAENDRLRGLVRDLWARRDTLLDFGFYAEVAEQLDELGIIDNG